MVVYISSHNGARTPLVRVHKTPSHVIRNVYKCYNNAWVSNMNFSFIIYIHSRETAMQLKQKYRLTNDCYKLPNITLYYTVHLHFPEIQWQPTNNGLTIPLKNIFIHDDTPVISTATYIIGYEREGAHMRCHIRERVLWQPVVGLES